MFCEAYQGKLKDAAAGSEPLGGGLRQHLNECAKCAAAWKVEQALFAVMDLQLRQAVNGEVPASLIAGVRQRVEANERQTTRWKPALAFTVALLMAGGFTVRLALRNSPNYSLTEKKDVRAVPAFSDAQSMEARAMEGNSSSADSAARGTLASGRVHRTSAAISDAACNREPMSAGILASPAEAAGLEQYMQRLRTRRIQVAAREEVKNSGSLEIHDVEIAELDLGVMAIPPLDGAK